MVKSNMGWAWTRVAGLAAIAAGSLTMGPQAAAQECSVKIGAVGPMTGTGASWGLAERAGAEFEATWVNEQGGLPMGDRKCRVVVVPYDSQSTAAGGAAASNYLASQGVHVVDGPVLSPENTGWKPVAKRNGQVSFTTTFAVDAIGPEWPLAFHQLQAPPVWGEAVIKAAKERLHFTKIAMIGPNDQGGTDTIEALQKLYNAAGVKTTVDYYQRGTTNFAPSAARIMASGADSVDFSGMPPGEGAFLAKQLLEAGYDGAFGRLGAGGDVIIKNAGGPEAFKAFYWFNHVPTDDPSMARFRDDYQRVMKSPLPDNALVYNAAISAEVLLKAISVADTDQDAEKIAAALRAMTPESRYLGAHGWRGKAQYGINQQLSFPVGVNFIIDGKLAPQVRVEVPAE